MGKSEKQALITGASAGLGKVFARELAARGYDLYITARRKERLEELAAEIEEKGEVKVTVVPCDLTLEEDRNRLYEATGGDENKIDLLVNNAGLGYLKPFVDHSWESCQKMIDLNVTAVTDLSYRYLNSMAQRGKGSMILVASTAAFQPNPYFSVYGATKGYDYLLGQSLGPEFKSRGVHILTLCPGPTRTEFGSDSGLEIEDDAPSLVTMSAEKVVKIALKGLRKKKSLVVPGFFNKLGIWGQRFLPRSVVRWFSARIMGSMATKIGGK